MSAVNSISLALTEITFFPSLCELGDNRTQGAAQYRPLCNMSLFMLGKEPNGNNWYYIRTCKRLTYPQIFSDLSDSIYNKIKILRLLAKQDRRSQLPDIIQIKNV